MVYTLTRNKQGKLKTRKYNRVKPLKAQYQAMRSTVKSIIIIILLVLLTYSAVRADNNFETVFTDVPKFVKIEEAPTQDEIAKSICTEIGLNDNCWKVLKAIRYKESTNGKYLVGDGGKSTGFYHIQNKLHSVSVECTNDYKCSTKWTAQNLKNNGFEKNEFTAIRKHNGSGSTAEEYARDVIRIIKYY